MLLCASLAEQALTHVFGRNILETGFFHAGELFDWCYGILFFLSPYANSHIAFCTDPHPGNIFVLDNGDIGLIDFGQVKQISGRNRETLAKVMVTMDDRVGDDRPEDLKRIGDLALELGLELNEDAKPEAAAATAMWLFDGTVEQLPGGYENKELSPNSPVTELKSFPQDLVLVGRSSILIKGLSSRLGIPWSLCAEWAPIARNVLDGKNSAPTSGTNGRVRFKTVWKTMKQWGKGRVTRAAKKLPSPIRSRVASMIVKLEERKSRRALTKRSRK